MTQVPAKLVSIVLPVYNGERYLAESIQSVLGQTYKNWELIIVNDCSTDDSVAIIESFAQKDPRIRIVHNATNLKLPNSLNAGFALSQGEYLTWTSDDNRFRPRALERMVDFLDEKPSVSLVYTDFTRISSEGEVLKKEIAAPMNELIQSVVVGACFLYKRSLYKALGDYKADLFLAEDYEYWLRASLSFELAPLNEDLYEYRMHQSSLTATRKREVIEAHSNLLLGYIDKVQYASARAKAKVLMTIFFNQKWARKPRFCWNLLAKSFYYSPIYFFRSLPKVIGFIKYIIRPPQDNLEAYYG